MSTVQAVSKPLHSVAILNNKATQEMELGDYDKAMSTFAQSLAFMQTIPQFMKILEGRSSCNKHNHGKNPQLPSFSFVSLLKNTPADSSYPGYLYKDAVRVVAFEQVRRQEGSSFFLRHVAEMLSYAIFFNLGLCHQLLGELNATTDPSRSVKLLKRSIKFYNRAQKIMNKHGMEGLCLMFGGDILLGLSVANNLGRIYRCLNQEATARLCFQRLWDAIRNVQGSVSSSRRRRRQYRGDGPRDNYKRGLSLLMVVLEEDYDNLHVLNGFLTNVLDSLFSTSQTAPAA